jgi:hypothetical protein
MHPHIANTAELLVLQLYMDDIAVAAHGGRGWKVPTKPISNAEFFDQDGLTISKKEAGQKARLKLRRGERNSVLNFKAGGDGLNGKMM